MFPTSTRTVRTLSARVSARRPRESQGGAENDVTDSNSGGGERRVAHRTVRDAKTVCGLLGPRPTGTQDREVEEAFLEWERRGRVRGGQGGTFRDEDDPDPGPDRLRRRRATVPRAGVDVLPSNAQREQSRSQNMQYREIFRADNEEVFMLA